MSHETLWVLKNAEASTKWKDRREWRISTLVGLEVCPTSDIYEHTRYVCSTVLLSCYYCSPCISRPCANVRLLGPIPRIDTQCSSSFYLLFIPFFDNVAVDRGTTAVTSILSWKVPGNCQTSRLRWIMRRHFPLHPLYISLWKDERDV